MRENPVENSRTAEEVPVMGARGSFGRNRRVDFVHGQRGRVPASQIEKGGATAYSTQGEIHARA